MKIFAYLSVSALKKEQENDNEQGDWIFRGIGDLR